MKVFAIFLAIFATIYSVDSCVPCQVQGDFRQQMLDGHNALRQKVASGQSELNANGQRLPNAASMPDLQWNDILAKAAQDHAMKCVYKHGDSQISEMGQLSVGQNIWQKSSSAESLMQTLYPAGPIESWSKEVSKVSNNLIDSFQGPPEPVTNANEYRHFSQMIWADTSIFGCGHSCYKQGNFYYQFVVCDYNSTGNLLNWPIYKRAGAGGDTQPQNNAGNQGWGQPQQNNQGNQGYGQPQQHQGNQGYGQPQQYQGNQGYGQPQQYIPGNQAYGQPQQYYYPGQQQQFNPNQGYAQPQNNEIDYSKPFKTETLPNGNKVYYYYQRM